MDLTFQKTLSLKFNIVTNSRWLKHLIHTLTGREQYDFNHLTIYLSPIKLYLKIFVQIYQLLEDSEILYGIEYFEVLFMLSLNPL